MVLTLDNKDRTIDVINEIKENLVKRNVSEWDLKQVRNEAYVKLMVAVFIQGISDAREDRPKLGKNQTQLSIPKLIRWKRRKYRAKYWLLTKGLEMMHDLGYLMITSKIVRTIIFAHERP